MALFDESKGRIVYLPPRRCEQNPDWEIIDCSCCNGLEWGRDYPTECRDCDGAGQLYYHIKSGVLALWPGGPFKGKLSKGELPPHLREE